MMRDRKPGRDESGTRYPLEIQEALRQQSEGRRPRTGWMVAAGVLTGAALYIGSHLWTWRRRGWTVYW